MVDTNITAYLLIQSDSTPHAIEVRRKDAHWCAPDFWQSEFRNVLWLYIRRNQMTISEAILRMEKAETLIDSVPVISDRVIELSADSGCTAYDCEFVSVAERLDIPLVTSDKKVLAAFPNIAISMEEFVSYR